MLVTGKVNLKTKIPNPDYEPPETATTGSETERASNNPFLQGPAAPAAGAAEDPDNPQYFYPEKYEFTVQFCWKQIKLRERIKAKQAAKIAAELEAEGL